VAFAEGDLAEVAAQLAALQTALAGRYGAYNHLEICNGNSRVRAQQVTGDRWAEDPAGYLGDEGIGLGAQWRGERMRVTPYLPLWRAHNVGAGS